MQRLLQPSTASYNMEARIVVAIFSLKGKIVNRLSLFTEQRERVSRRNQKPLEFVEYKSLDQVALRARKK